MALPPPPPGILIDMASGVLLLALGVFVASVKPRRRANVAFAVFSSAIGVGFVTLNLSYGLVASGSEASAAFATTAVLFTVAAGALTVASRVLTPRAHRRRAAVVGILVTTPTFAVAAWTAWNAEAYAAIYGFPASSIVALSFFVFAFATLVGVVWAVVVHVAEAAGAADERTFRQAALACAGLVLWPAFLSGNALLGGNRWDFSLGVAGLLPAAVVTGRWLAYSARGRAPALSRNVAFACLGAMLLGLLVVPLSGGFVASQRTGGFGLMRTLAVIVLAYGIVRHQLFDIDLKLKWTIQRGTVAAVFVAVFFIVAEIGQNYLTGELGWAAGGIAAGLLLFAIAPLQRAAERVADVAMPGVKNTPQYVATRKEESYRFAVRMAYADRVLSRDEERNLANLAADLGIDAARAFAVREEVEREIGFAVPAEPVRSG